MRSFNRVLETWDPFDDAPKSHLLHRISVAACDCTRASAMKRKNNPASTTACRIFVSIGSIKKCADRYISPACTSAPPESFVCTVDHPRWRVRCARFLPVGKAMPALTTSNLTGQRTCSLQKTARGWAHGAHLSAVRLFN